ncbi:16S rRNA (guanine(527)-N(7))-methyltransferase RsmG [Castellaniella defragrans]|uniref:Ribosomal RNA small subunit methyltransferase G n=1 Tax=Castellaniella defragrans TaxID=75697 RepID=A0A7W9WQ33_CASDE|nr:16S rRNA (guanine(527)-N(7))-methyltransferase RsmG [Castellaniella defragrans]KAB0622953.1 16S rRNA (guanine(527)-N(7))-methyltransferase RsmG [Castellaniella defragrans]MBB6085521.1 16S rRNA (guanine527-N7)-methyltransferase [Castellaniella defragrans]
MSGTPPFPEFRARLENALDALGMQADHARIPALLGYLQQLQHWNKAYNLTAVRDPGKMLVQHVFDSLAIVPELRARWPRRALRVADMGSGAGLPGIILAICQPDWTIVCVDAVGKKTAFIRQAAGVLGLKNVRAEHGRIESMDSLQADLVISRAFASLSDFVRVAAHHRAPGGILLAMKGQDPVAERAALEAGTGWYVKRAVELDVPEMDASRCLLELDSTGPEGTP